MSGELSGSKVGSLAEGDKVDHNFMLRSLKPSLYFLVVPNTQLSLGASKLHLFHAAPPTPCPMSATTWITIPTHLPLSRIQKK